MRLALIDISSSDLSKASSELKLPEDDILTIEADVSKYEDMLEAAKKVKEKFGEKSTSVLCLNAGVGESGTTTWNGKVDTWTKVRSSYRLNAFRKLRQWCADPRCQPVRSHQRQQRLHEFSCRFPKPRSSNCDWLKARHHSTSWHRSILQRLESWRQDIHGKNGTRVEGGHAEKSHGASACSRLDVYEGVLIIVVQWYSVMSDSDVSAAYER